MEVKTHRCQGIFLCHRQKQSHPKNTGAFKVDFGFGDRLIKLPVRLRRSITHGNLTPHRLHLLRLVTTATSPLSRCYSARTMEVHSLNPILNVSDFAATVAWFEKWGWKKLWDWGTPPTFGAVGSGKEACIFLCQGAQGGSGRGANTTTFQQAVWRRIVVWGEAARTVGEWLRKGPRAMSRASSRRGSGPPARTICARRSWWRATCASWTQRMERWPSRRQASGVTPGCTETLTVPSQTSAV